MSTDKKVIYLTGRTPVRITETAWNIIASGDRRQYSTGPSIDVRQHADGRVLVCGQDSKASSSGNLEWQHREGQYLTGTPTAAAIVSAIESVGYQLHTRSDSSWSVYRELIADTIANLDPEDID